MNVHEQIGSRSAQQIADLARHQPEMLHSCTLSPLSAAQVMELSRGPAVDIALAGFEQGNGALNADAYFCPPAPIAALAMSQVKAMTIHRYRAAKHSVERLSRRLRFRASAK